MQYVLYRMLCVLGVASSAAPWAILFSFSICLTIVDFVFEGSMKD
jgi:hypothetical protein